MLCACSLITLTVLNFDLNIMTCTPISFPFIASTLDNSIYHVVAWPSTFLTVCHIYAKRNNLVQYMKQHQYIKMKQIF